MVEPVSEFSPERLIADYRRVADLALEAEQGRSGADGEITVIQSALTQLSVGQLVKIEPVEAGAKIIDEFYYERGVFGSHQMELDWHRPKQAVGSISQVDLRAGRLAISPQRFSRASQNRGYYEVPVLDPDNNEPLIRIEMREKSWRDKQHLIIPTIVPRRSVTYT